uniref:Unconventional myosin-XV-like n=1 Tax=Saccoglossus kowalevskii TaxID=10224 RepID=A0ABM0MDR2_SACKO
ILEANPLLESFGNAKTIKNDNSSRFGKYIEVFFSGVLCEWQVGRKGGSDGLIVENQSEIKLAAKLLQLPQDLLSRAVTYRLTETRDEQILTPLTYEQACDARDAISKSLYARLFTWLVERINSIISKGQRITSIAILDIFGFEVFRVNSFEQFSINYANENLQYYFNKHIFKLEQQEYTRERIPWTQISFNDNQPCLDLISKRPIGIIHLLDDESCFPKASDNSFLEKCHHQHSGNPYYIRPKMPGSEFGVNHYAGPVTYQVSKFLDKNRDHLRSDVVEMLIESKSPVSLDV